MPVWNSPPPSDLPARDERVGVRPPSPSSASITPEGQRPQTASPASSNEPLIRPLATDRPAPSTPLAVPVEPETPKRRGRGWKALGGAAVAAGLVAGGVGIGIAVDDDDPTLADAVAVAAATDIADDADTDTSALEAGDVADTAEPAVAAPPQLTTDPGPVSDDAKEPVAAVADAVSPSVVRIDTPTGTGSGIIYDASGLLVTNAHVINGFEEVSIRLADGTRAPGTVIGADPNVDVAVVRIDADVDLPVAVFAPTTTVDVGQLAVAIGSPFGLEQSVTAGIVSAVNRVITNTNVVDGSPTIVEMVQTDAPINPGNSGGALVDRQGRVVGMNTSIRTDGTTQGNLGVGFAIPSDTVLLVAERIVNGESLESGFLGISGVDPTVGRPGAQVTEVVEGGPAEDAGLLAGDLIVAIDGSPIIGMSELAARIRISNPGTVIDLEVIREGEPVDLSVELGTLGAQN